MNTDRRPGSRMPDDPTYWQDLAARSINAALAPDSAGSRAAMMGVAADAAATGVVTDATATGLAQDSAAAVVAPDVPVPGVSAPFWHSLSDAAFMLAASALLALLGGTQLMEERTPLSATQTHVLTNAIAPRDDLVTTLLNADAPPPAMAMLWVVARREVER